MPKSAQVSGFNVAARNYQTLVNAVINIGGGDDDMNRLHTDCELRRRIAELLVGKSPIDTFPLTVDYGQSLAEMVAAGMYSYASPDITAENFPVGSGEASVETILVQMERTTSDEEVLAEMGRRGLRPASMVELLAFGAQYPEIQRKFMVAAFGSVWEAGRKVGCLSSSLGDRDLCLYWLSGDWYARDRFLAVRK